MRMKWKPIETAPKDGTVVLVSEGDYPRFIGAARYDKQHKTWWLESSYAPAFPEIWMDLPKNPVPDEYKFQYECPKCNSIMFYRKEKPLGCDDISDTWIGSIYPDGTPLKPTDSKACRHCGCDHLELENFWPR